MTNKPSNHTHNYKGRCETSRKRKTTTERTQQDWITTGLWVFDLLDEGRLWSFSCLLLFPESLYSFSGFFFVSVLCCSMPQIFLLGLIKLILFLMVVRIFVSAQKSTCFKNCPETIILVKTEWIRQSTAAVICSSVWWSLKVKYNFLKQ